VLSVVGGLGCCALALWYGRLARRRQLDAAQQDVKRLHGEVEEWRSRNGEYYGPESLLARAQGGAGASQFAPAAPFAPSPSSARGQTRGAALAFELGLAQRGGTPPQSLSPRSSSGRPRSSRPVTAYGSYVPNAR